MDLGQLERNTQKTSNSARAIAIVIVYGFQSTFLGLALFIGGWLFAARDNDVYNSAMAYGGLVFVGGNLLTFFIAASRLSSWP